MTLGPKAILYDEPTTGLDPLAARKFDMLEREELKSVIKELDFGESDYADTEKVVKIGQLIGADYMIVPEIRYLQVVRESKEISSDARALAMAREIRDLLGKRFNVVTIGPAAYNRLYSKMGNVNAMLAWGHARVIENLMGQRHRMNPPPVRAISDQFASNKAVVAKALMRLGRELDLIQRHKAESDLAVAAASMPWLRKAAASIRAPNPQAWMWRSARPAIRTWRTMRSLPAGR
jgi:hypothetical protein